jgi:hypothetical protein
VLVVESVVNKGFGGKMNSLSVKIVVSHQYLVFSKENAGKLVKDGFPFPWE